MFYQKITNSLILCIFCSILSISFRSIRFYNIFRRNARDLGNLRNDNSSLKCAADWLRPHKTSKMGESTMTEKRYLKWYWLCHYAGGNFRHPDQSGTVCTVRMVPDRIYSAERCILHCQQHCLLCTDCSRHEEQCRTGRDGFLAFHVRLCHQPAHPVHHAGCCYGIGRWCCRLAHCCNHLRHSVCLSTPSPFSP